MFERDRTFGQIEPAANAGTVTAAGKPSSPVTYFFTAVAAGVTVFLITRYLGKRLA